MVIVFGRRWQARKEGDKQMRAGLIPSRMLQEKRIAYERANNNSADQQQQQGTKSVFSLWPRFVFPLGLWFCFCPAFPPYFACEKAAVRPIRWKVWAIGTAAQFKKSCTLWQRTRISTGRRSPLMRKLPVWCPTRPCLDPSSSLARRESDATSWSVASSPSTRTNSTPPFHVGSFYFVQLCPATNS